MGSLLTWPQCSELSVEIKRLFHMSRLQSFVKLFNFHETNISIYFLSDVAAQTNGSCYYLCHSCLTDWPHTSQDIRLRNSVLLWAKIEDLL